MRRSLKIIAGVSAWLALLGTSGLVGAAAVPGADPASKTDPVGVAGPVEKIRSFATVEHGIRRPTGLAWDTASRRLVISGAHTSTGTTVVALTPAETRREKLGLRWLPAGEPIAVDPTDGAFGRVPATDVRDPAAATYTASGTLLVLDAGSTVVRIAPTGAVTRTQVQGVAGHSLRGIATAPDSSLAYTYDATAKQLLGIGSDGAIKTRNDASELDLTNVSGLAFAPSADRTDAPSTTSLYIADAGAGKVTGEIVETTLQATAVAALAATTGTLIRTVATSAYNPPSPDPSGVTYLPGPDRLFTVDGEVDEMTIFQGKNFFRTTRAGVLDDTGVSQPWSDEPVGVGYNPGNNHLIVSDDDQKEVFDIAPGADGRYGTPDDGITHFDTAAFGNTDPEGVEFDAATGSIWTVDGVNTQVYRYRPGPDGQFGTSDDIRSNFDIAVYGARDPEGIGFDSVRDTIVVVDDGSDTIYELDRAGGLLNTISTTSANMVAAAGLTVAPGSTNPSIRTYCVVARGLDNDSHPTENDGRMYELSASLPPVGSTNQPPQVSAGPDQSVILPASATLDGTVTDDGRPNPPGAVTASWSKVTGFGTVTFGNPNAADTTATFSDEGTYTLRLTVNDGEVTVADDVTVLVLPVGSPNAVEVRVANGSDDAEQAVSGSTALTSSDLELVTDGATQQIVGTRFTGLQIPAGATIVNAYVQFRTDEVSTDAANITIRAEAADNTPTYQAVSGNLANRATTTANVAWTPPAWNVIGESGAAQRTPNIASLVQAVVDRPGWSQGNAFAVQFRGTGRRTAEAFEGGGPSAPLLHVEYSTGAVTNRAPTVDAGIDQSVILPASATLDATVTDDGRPNPPGAVTTTWSATSGPGTVTFGNPNAVDTTATFSSQGDYVLRLTATDGDLTAFDQVTVHALPSGTTQSLEVRVATGSDDAEQAVSGNTALTSADLELVTDGNTQQIVGTRFTGLQIPAGAAITNAYIQFRTDEVSTDVANLTIRAEAADNTPTYQAVSGNVAARATTAQSVSWTPPAWNTVNEAGTAQRTPNIANLVQAVVDRPGWSPGNALAIQFRGTGRRTADSFEDAFGPLLHVDYSAGAVSNRPPNVDAGVDRSVVLPNALSLDGTVTDDGLPTPPGAVSTTWSMTSGPGTATFGNPNAVDTTATFSGQGDYVLRLTATDGDLTTFDEVTVHVLPAGTTQSLDVRVAAGSDDAEQAVSGSTALASSDLELVTDGTTQQIVGIRFIGLQLPAGATITNAYVQFRTDEVSSDVANLTIRAEAADNAPTYLAVSGNIANRATTAANVAWTPPAWNTVNEVGAGQRTPDLASLIQAVVNRPGWSQGNALALQIRGTGRRTADAFESGANFAPLLHVDWNQ
jgi:hypothetical protein